MKYYKLINGSEFIGIGTSADFRRFQVKHKIFLGCDESEAQYIQCGDSLYRAMWMVPENIPESSYITLDIIEIEKEEYDTLFKAAETGEDVQIEPQPDLNNDDDITDCPTEITIEYIRTQKITEMSNASEATIIAGTDITLSDGSTNHYSFSLYDQSRIGFLASAARTAEMLETMGMPTGETGKDYMWHHDSGNCTYYSRQDMMIVGTVMQNFITYHNSYFHALREYIESLDSMEDIISIYYGIDVPDDFKGDVLMDSETIIL